MNKHFGFIEPKEQKMTGLAIVIIAETTYFRVIIWAENIFCCRVIQLHDSMKKLKGLGFFYMNKDFGFIEPKVQTK